MQDCYILKFCNLYHPTRKYDRFYDVLVNGIASHMLVSLCLFGSNLNIHAKPENSDNKDTTGT